MLCESIPLKASCSQLSTLKMEMVMTLVPITVEEDTDLTSARRIMRENKIRHLPVVCEGKLTGILSDRDVKLASQLASFGRVAVSDVMSRNPAAVKEDSLVLEAVAMMAANKYGSIVVTDNGGTVRGIFTTQDVLTLLLGERGLNIPATTAYPLAEEDDEEEWEWF